MASVQRVELEDGPTWTVLGREYLPIPEVERFLEHLRRTGRSPNTVKSYARALALWWEFLDVCERDWTEASLDVLGGFLGWLRNGFTPDVIPLGLPPPRASEATVAVRLQAVRSFYRFEQLRGAEVGWWLFEPGRSGSHYRPFLAHLEGRRPAVRATVSVRRRRSQPPVLTPAQMAAIKDCCARYDPEQRAWMGSVRDRLLFSLLEETGLRLGEALGLQHQDWHTGGGANPYIEVVPRDHPHGVRGKSDYRKVYVSDQLDRLYAEHVWRLCEAGMDLVVADMDAAYVFVNVAAGELFAPMRPETVYKLVRRITKKLGGQVPAGWTPHWFRHTHATGLLLSGRPVHAVSRRLGHRDVQTTLDTYAWVTDDEELRSLADRETATRRWKEDHGQEA